ncbi:hypothetical protein LCGC14_2097300 [marine sediment metagenome]|uniref:Uncharacterized protein n=1 Tax=marine sediment metagenome TaxID=412755 RepID=A0A0F9EY69_9ZZZZ
MTGSIYTGEFFLVTLQIDPANTECTDSYSILARNADVAIKFAKEQAERDGYEYGEIRGLTILAGPEWAAGDLSKIFEYIPQ